MALSSQKNHINPDAMNIMIESVNLCFDKADAFFGNSFKRSSCNFKQRGRAAGTAHLQKNEIRFNYFMYQQDPEIFISTVVPHEVAHIIVFQIYGGNVKPHGKEWQAVMMKVYGIKPDRTHTFDTPVPKETYQYYCECQEHNFTKQRHTRSLRGTQYICKNCKSTLQFLAIGPNINLEPR
ncbi:SprT protein [Marinomonas ushuaiensis DSM 15871]|uniref:SprT protein n=1 Tax=Marinomonas ushuaiensis DSM 15871 TaxID=1122207 RepID=X7E8L1_9GAMM|nr:SprT family zinc-dependent metalloprotease [Marinomonas ushuaiensis]ETX11483.1 SprT protein [Marinomonas ushuaiensis DSM 15871]